MNKHYSCKNNGGKVKQRDPKRLCTTGTYLLPDPRDSALGCELVENQAALVLLIMKQTTFSGRFLYCQNQLGNDSKVHPPTLPQKPCSSSWSRKQSPQLD